MHLVNKVKLTIAAYNLLEAGDDHLLVALSGGADSVALLEVLDGLSTHYGFKISAAHLNHGLRGHESDEDEEFVRGLCRERGIVCLFGRLDSRIVDAAKGRSLEEVCREARYRFLKEAAEKIGAKKIATAHTRDDRAETVMMNIIRGAGLEGIRGVAPLHDGKVIRPFFNVTKQEIREFLRERGLSNREDGSNFDDRFLRNRIRNRLMPHLARDYNPRIMDALCTISEIARMEDDYLQAAVKEALDGLGLAEGVGEAIPLQGLPSLHEAIQRRVVKFILQKILPEGSRMNFGHIEAVLDGIRKKAAVLDLPGGVRVRVSDGIMYLKKGEPSRRGRMAGQEEPHGFSYPASVPGSVFIKECNKVVLLEVIEKPDPDIIKGLPRAAFIDMDKVSFPLVVRNRRSGDWFTPLGMKGRKTLKSFFIERKIPCDERDLTPLLVDELSVIWVAKERISDRVKVTPDTKRVLKVEVI